MLNITPVFGQNFNFRFFLSVSLLFLVVFSSFGQNVYQTKQDGKWTSSSTWKNNDKPSDIITNGETIIIDHIIDFENIKINNGGTIIINAPLSGLQLDMNSGSSITVNSPTTITSFSLNGGTINLNNTLTSTNFTATPGSSIYTANPSLLAIPAAVKNDLQTSEAIKGPSTLPITLISFTCKSSAEANVLNWATTMEYNSAYTALERSSDGKNFEEINRQASTNNYRGQSNYQYQDNRPAAGVNFYRLRQADFDGTVTYSKIIASAANPFKIYTNGQVYFNAPVSGKASVISTTGAVVMQQSLSQVTQMNIDQLPTGIYVLVIEQGNQVYKQKIAL